MRDFRDAKAMAHALREALKDDAVDVSHSRSLELIAKAFGYENCNVLSAKIEGTRPRSIGPVAASAATQEPAPPETFHCSFCAKIQHDVQKLDRRPIGVYLRGVRRLVRRYH